MHEKRLREIAAELATIETRADAIHTAVETAEQADLEQLNSEVSELETRQAALLAEKAKLEAEVDEARAFDESKAIELTEGDKKMNLEEIRRSQAYINAYAEYFKTMLREGKADDTELRALLSDQITVSGTAGVPTPIYVEERINTAWDNDEIMGRILRSEVPGILKVGFELSATAAVVHTEGAAAPSEEVLNLGIVALVPGTIKKWLTLSDEIMDTHGQAFLDYIFDEIEHKIIKKAADLVVADITGSPTTATTSAAAVSNISISAASLHDFVDALATLSDEATDNVIIMNKSSYATYKGLQMAANYGVDPFDGMPVLFNDTLYAAASATTGQAIAIVGDLKGVRANFPNGYQPTFKYDDLSLAEKDLVKIVGRLPMGHGVVASKRFCVIKKS